MPKEVATCELDCPVRDTCGVYIGLSIVQKNGKVVSCNRQKFYSEKVKQNEV